MVSSPIYLKDKVFKSSTPCDELDDKFTILMLEEKRYGIYHQDPISTMDIWNTWPNYLKELFLKKFFDYETNLVTSYWD